ncbi:MAG: pyridoxamine 5'-phosphate oxidase family protein [Desulfobulbaceae bacterium]|uniref:Pyridoxamine 5'-phosphate oxidase family protein n=1 Tax=Candidatus Desulfobia pelagia TaxID=2841692 RepID=A0A8J6NF35_9BACT|nr:pyridoxamine 5'-phosphate oxidase family protein [Candidatus Desulfobia pelagia]
MNLEKYFTDKTGVGVIATSDDGGVVDTAIYSRPHVMGNDEVAFVMRDRLTHKNLQENSHASYLFLENRQGFIGVRLFLTKISESSDHALIDSMTRRHLSSEEDKARGEKFLVRFKVNKVLSLIGGEEIPID